MTIDPKDRKDPAALVATEDTRHSSQFRRFFSRSRSPNVTQLGSVCGSRVTFAKMNYLSTWESTESARCYPISRCRELRKRQKYEPLESPVPLSDLVRASRLPRCEASRSKKTVYSQLSPALSVLSQQQLTMPYAA